MTHGTPYRLLHPGLLAAALALSASGLAYGDNFVGTDFQKEAQMASMLPSPPPADYTGYYKLNISVLGDTAWIPETRGAQGPIRNEGLNASPSEESMKAVQEQQDMDHRIAPIGGLNTF